MYAAVEQPPSPFDDPLEDFAPKVPKWRNLTPLNITAPARKKDTWVEWPASDGPLRISFHDAGVRVQAGPVHVRDYGILKNKGLQAIDVTIEELAGQTFVRGGGYELTVYHTPFSFELKYHGKLVQKSLTDGHFVQTHRLPPLAKCKKGWLVNLELHSGEPVYGLGEKWGNLNKRGQMVRSHNHDALGVNAELSYKNTPFAWSPEGWGIFVHTPFSVTHSIGYAPWSHRSYGLHCEDDSLDLFIFAGQDGAEIIRHYTDLTGRADMPPDWSLGVILSRAYYKDAGEVLETARQVRAHKMPCDVITFDGRAWQDTETRFAFEWCPVRYPDPKPVLDELKDMGFKICVWEYPMVSVKNPLFAWMEEKGWLLKNADGSAYRYDWDLEPFGPVLTPLPQSGIVDFTHPDAYNWWRDRHQPLFEQGIDMIKADFGEQVPDDVHAHNGATGHELHNVYALLYNRCVYEAAKMYGKTGAFIFSRSGWSGSQCFPSCWGGDPQADWEGLAASIRGGLSWGMSGGPFYASDVGGFYGDRRDEKLYVRWIQAAVFSAHMRLHGIGAREPWSYGETAEKAAFDALRLRYRLLPYIHAAMQQATETGMPVKRAMALAFPDDPAGWAFENQFMFGDDIFVAPCLNDRGHIRFYLPRGRWQRLQGDDDEILEGGRVYDLTLKLEETAVFKRADARIPFGPDAEFVET